MRPLRTIAKWSILNDAENEEDIPVEKSKSAGGLKL